MNCKITYLMLLFSAGMVGKALPLKAAPGVPASSQPEVLRSNGARPAAFMENKGQVKDQYGQYRSDIDFKLQEGNMSLFVGKGKLHYQWYRALGRDTVKTDQPVLPGRRNPTVKEWGTYRVDLTLLGANPHAKLTKSGQVAYAERYYGSGIPEQGYRSSGYQKLTYEDIYPHIDWVLYIKDQGIEYDFVVHPGGNVADIRLQYDGADEVRLEPGGGLLIRSPYGTIREGAPYTYQADGQKITSYFKAEGNQLSFVTGPYQGVLTIDPKVQWATYYGGNYLFEDMLTVYADPDHHVYGGGQTTTAANIATTGAFQTTIRGLIDAYLVKFNAKGERLWCTYYGGDGIDRGGLITGDSLGNVYYAFANMDAASGLATTGGFQTNPGGASDVVLAKFKSDGERIWATYCGGSGDDGLGGMVWHGQALYLSGSTSSPDKIATAGAFQGAFKGALDIFVVKYSADGQRVWGTYYGSDKFEYPRGVAVDQQGHIYVSGMTNGGSGLASPGSYQPTLYENNEFEYDALLLKLDAQGNRLWATYFGGEGEEYANSVACDLQGNVYISGTTRSTRGVATANSFQSSHSNAERNDCYMAKFTTQGNLFWATYYGGDSTEGALMLSVMEDDHVMVAGNTSSYNKMTTEKALQNVYGGGSDEWPGDWFVARFTPEGQREWSTYYGGAGDDAVAAVYVDKANFLVVGASNSATGVATPGSHQDTYPDPMIYTGLLAKFCFAITPGGRWISGADSVCPGSAQRYAIPDMEDLEGCIWTLPEDWTGESNSRTIDVVTGENSGEVTVRIIRCGDTSVVSILPVYVHPGNKPVITVDGFELGTTRSYNAYQWFLNRALINGATGARLAITENGDYTVATLDENGCPDTSAVYKVTNVNIEERVYSGGILSVYPNPANDYLYIRTSLQVTVSITAVDGKLLHRQSAPARLDISGWAKGMYFISATDKSGKVVHQAKWVKM